MIDINQASDILDEFEKCGCRNPAHLKDLINQSIEAKVEQDKCPHHFIHNNRCAECGKEPMNREGTL